jgi:hypothetical protein
MKMLTVDDCNLRMTELNKELLEAIEELGQCEAVDLLAAKIAVWERVRHHLVRGQIITIDGEERLKMWENVVQA